MIREFSANRQISAARALLCTALRAAKIYEGSATESLLLLTGARDTGAAIVVRVAVTPSS